MFRFLFPTVLTVVAAMTLLGGECIGQLEVRDELVDRIADGSKGILVLNDLEVVTGDIERLLKDVGFGGVGETAKTYLDLGSETGLSGRSGLIWYMQDGTFSRVEEMRIDDRTRFFAHLGNGGRPQPVETVTFELDPAKAPLNDLGSLLGGQASHGIVSGRRFLAFRDDEIFAKSILTALPLAAKLDETSRGIINTAGIAVIGQADREQIESTLDLPAFFADYAENVTEAEQQWLHSFADVVSSAWLGMLAIKYHDGVLQFRSRALIGQQQSFEGLIDFSTAHRDWHPELGLEVEQLVLSAAIQMDAFRSSAAARVVPQVLLRESGRGRQLEFLHGNMLRILAELSGDSWNDLSAARVGLYQNDEVENTGQLAIVGIADARNPEDVLTELRRLSRLTSPEALSVKAAEREDELLQLVDELTSDDYNISDRAETRLVLAGQAAVPALEKGASAWNETLRERAERVLQRIHADADAAGKVVVDPGFWTTLNPGLRLEESTGKVTGFATHIIHVTPDPSKNRDDVDSAIEVMKNLFGDSWNAIRVVQVRNHFVFMIGSDSALLERIVQNVDGGKSVLTLPFSDSGLTPVHGQIQACINTVRVMELMGMRDFQDPDGKPYVANELSWIGLDFDPQAASADALVPARQIIPFLSMGMGF